MTFVEAGIACPGLPPAEPVGLDYAARVVTALRDMGFEDAHVVTRESWPVNGLHGVGFVHGTWAPAAHPATYSMSWPAPPHIAKQLHTLREQAPTRT